MASRPGGSPAARSPGVRQNGAPPYLMRWENGYESVFVPSSDTLVEHHPARRTAS